MSRLLASWFLIVAAALPARAEDAKPAAPRFELKDGDRVVLLGNTLIEREQKYGHWEAMLTARYPDRHITFRNLGWDGDTVWAESRGIFDSPEVGYRRMIDQVKGLKPTVIFLGYGGNEAFAGPEGIPAFVKQYEKLLDDLTKASPEEVRFVILLPPEVAGRLAPLPDPANANRNIRLYKSAIRELADRRRVSVLSPIYDDETYAQETGVKNARFPVTLPKSDEAFFHLSENGYRVSASHLATQWYGLTRDTMYGAHLLIDWSGEVIDRSIFEPIEAKRLDGGLEFTAKRPYLGWSDFFVLFRNLPAGRFALVVDGRKIRTDTNAEWYKSVADLASHPEREQYEALRKAIIKKNELYFHSWRPQNVTYLFGFRKHEQGQNAKETAEFEKLVAEKEAEIAILKKPKPHKYELIRAAP